MTIGEKLTCMRGDLAALVAFLNRDESYSLALEAQSALAGVDNLSNSACELGTDELPFPPTDEDRQVQPDE